MWFWPAVIVVVGVYVALDAFFEISAKISRWFKSSVQPKLGRVVAQARDGVLKTHPARSTWDGEAPARAGVDWLALLRKSVPLLIIVTVFFGLIGLSRGWISFGDFGKSRDTIRAERDTANVNTGVAEHETTVANRGAELAEETHRDARRRDRVIAQAQQEIDDAVSQADFDRLRDAYGRAYDGVWNDRTVSSESDHPETGSAPVRRPGGDHA